MPHLNLALLGPFQLTLEDPAATRVESDKVRGLLAFLAVERDRPRPWHALTEPLWPGQSDNTAIVLSFLQERSRRRSSQEQPVVVHSNGYPPPVAIVQTPGDSVIASAAFCYGVISRAVCGRPGSRGWPSGSSTMCSCRGRSPKQRSIGRPVAYARAWRHFWR